MSRLNELHVQRGRLLERIEAQREALYWESEPIQAALDRTDQVIAYGRAGVAYVKRHPGIMALAVGTLVALRGRRVLRVARRAFILWRTWRTLRERVAAGLGLVF